MMVAIFAPKKESSVLMVYIGDANDPDTIRADAAIFFSTEFAATDADEVTALNKCFVGPLGPNLPAPPYTNLGPPFWPYFEDIAGLVQVYDLVAPLDAGLAETCLSRLGAIAGALLANRDDNRGFPADAFRGRVMPAWGGPDDAGNWHSDVGVSALFTYAMAAFARRVVQQPSLYAKHGADAIRFITATIETYQAFRADIRWVDAYAYFILPLSEDPSGSPSKVAYNLDLAMMQTLAEVAPAADSSLYRNSTHLPPDQLQTYIKLATEEGPLLIARFVAFRIAQLRPLALDDGTPYYAWDYFLGAGGAEDTNHSQLELGCLAVIYDRQIRLNALLARAGYNDRVTLSPSIFVRFANTFLRVVWHNNVLSGDSAGGAGEDSKDCAGWIPLAQFDPWVWTRARDTLAALTEMRTDNHGALLRYRKFNSMKYLTDFTGQNWLITPAALAVGEPKPTSIYDQKWLLVLTGVVLANLKGEDSWNSQTVSFIPDMAGPDDPSATSGPLNWAISHYSIPKPAGSPGAQYLIRFSVEEWAPSVSLSAIFDQNQSINAGFAVNAWRPNSFGGGTDVISKQPVNNLFAGINADLAVSDSDAWLYRLGYNITLLGKIAFIAPTLV
jgi:hypothetical protein